jgi:DNA modification methylase
MRVVHNQDRIKVVLGDSLEVLRKLPDASVHAVVTDPPYGLTNTDPSHVVTALTRWVGGERDYIPSGRGFMGKEWDSFVPPPALWDEVLRILKPGGYLLSFAGTRTHDLMTLSIRLSGFDIRDSIAWMHSEGFPKGGSKIEVAGQTGWGTQLKPSFEPIVVARKPFRGTVKSNVAVHSTGALNIDGTRVGFPDDDPLLTWGEKYGGKLNSKGEEYATKSWPKIGSRPGVVNAAGRWPANVVLDEDQAASLDEQSGVLRSGSLAGDGVSYADEGGASRFYYVAKAKRNERPEVNGVVHPTVKPLDLMRWLVRLVTPPEGIVLDPFAGSGTTAEAALLEGFPALVVEREETYIPLIQQRLTRSKA